MTLYQVLWRYSFAPGWCPPSMWVVDADDEDTAINETVNRAVMIAMYNPHLQGLNVHEDMVVVVSITHAPTTPPRWKQKALEASAKPKFEFLKRVYGKVR